MTRATVTNHIVIHRMIHNTEKEFTLNIYLFLKWKYIKHNMIMSLFAEKNLVLSLIICFFMSQEL